MQRYSAASLAAHGHRGTERNVASLILVIVSISRHHNLEVAWISLSAPGQQQRATAASTAAVAVAVAFGRGARKEKGLGLGGVEDWTGQPAK